MSESPPQPTSDVNEMSTLHIHASRPGFPTTHSDTTGSNTSTIAQGQESGELKNTGGSYGSGPTKPLNRKVRRKCAIFRTALPLLFHGLFVVAVSCFMLIALDDHKFSIKHRDLFKDVRDRDENIEIPFFDRWMALQTDMITTLSVLIVMARFFLTAWCADVAWKCIFILLERAGLSVSQISGLITYKVLLPSRLPSDDRPKGQWRHYALVMIILFSSFPAHISSPIITGAITWTPSYELLKTAPLQGISTFTSGVHWSNYQRNELGRQEVIFNAARLYNLFYPAALTGPAVKRSLSAAHSRALEPNSTISNITMPFSSFKDLKWITEKPEIPPYLFGAIDFVDGWLNITRFDRELITRESFALIPPSRRMPVNETGGGSQNQLPFYEAPPKMIFNDILYLAYWPRWNESGSCDVAIAGELRIPNNVYWHLQDGTCYAFAQVHVLVGTKPCPDCTIENSAVVTSYQNYTMNPDELPNEDPLVSEILWLMPQVISRIVETASLLPKDGTVEDYLYTTMQRAYASAWSALTDYTSEPLLTLTSDAKSAVSCSEAVVSHTRVYIWIAFQALVWAGACIFAVVQWRCERPLTVDTIMAAIFLENHTQVQSRASDTGLSEVIILSTEKHNRKLGALKLKYDSNNNRSELIQWKSDVEVPSA